MSNPQTQIGKIVNVNGHVVSVQLSDHVKSNILIFEGVAYKIGQIGSFLKIPLGYANLYGVITQIGSAAIPNNVKEIIQEDYSKLENKQWLSIVLAGEQIGKQFSRGISQFPTTDDNVHLVTTKDLNIIYGDYDKDKSIIVGNISASESLQARIDLDKIIIRHAAILGSTGSGKSNAVGVLLKAIAEKKFPRARILVIDPHGEYNAVLTEQSNVYKITNISTSEKALFIPFWALPFNELMGIFPGDLNDQKKEYIRDKIVEAKIKALKSNKINLDESLITADSPIPFSIKQLWFELDDFERQTYTERAKPETSTKYEDGDAEKLISNKYIPASAGGGAPFLNNQAKGILGFLNSMKIKLLDSRYHFLFEPYKYTPDLNGKVERDLSDLLFNWLGSDSPVTILDLSGIPSEIMTSISGSLLKIIYDALFWGQNVKVGGKQQPLYVVLEEAHSYLKAGENSVASESVQTIASRTLKSQYFVYFQLNHAASRLGRNELCAFTELIFSENKHFE